MQHVVILGAGGHAQVVAEVLMRARDCGTPIEPVGYLDDDPRTHGSSQLGLPVLGDLGQLSKIAHDAVIVAIGDNTIRSRLFHKLRDRGELFATVRHPGAVIASDVQVGHGSVISAGVIVNPGSVIGDNVILNTSCTVEHHNRIGDHVHIAPGVRLGGDVVIEEGTLVGIGATVMPQRKVGAWSVVGAAALVHSDVPEHAVVVGVPGRIIRYRDRLADTEG